MALSLKVDCPIVFCQLSREDFDRVSHQIMTHVFASQNELGRLCDERIYRNDVALRLESAGLGPVATEVPVTVRCRDFHKVYYLDLVFQNGFIGEFKATEALSSEHDAQLLNYLFLTGQKQGKLINMRPAKVGYRTINAVVPEVERFEFTLDTDRFRPRSPQCALLLDKVREILETWGAFLDFRLYRDALIHFMGGESLVLHRVPIARDGRLLGSQIMSLLTEGVALEVTALPSASCASYEAHLRRFTRLTGLNVLHWLNFHQRDIRLVTISCPPGRG